LSDAAQVLERCAELGAISEEDGLLVRRFGTPAMRRANELVGRWMREAGLTVREDAVGNLIGRRGDGPAFMLGSHLDTVRDAGRYDGPLGVLVALAAVERTETPVQVVGFADEEGLRFGTAYLGSAAMVGRFDPAWLERTDEDGVALTDLLSAPPPPGDRPLGYAEVHIEQGPVLEQLGEPLGAVTAIAGQSHARVTFGGEAGHAGTVPMDARHDALAGAAEWVLAVEAAGGTVGRLTVEPGARNVIPAVATLSLDVRDADDRTRLDAVAALRARAGEIAARRGLRLAWEDTGDIPAVQMDERLTELLGAGLPRLASGAGHDAAMMASVAPAAMLFVRCRGGVSHHPDESVEEADVAAAIDALERFLRAL
jgi:allantoate deiminase